MPSNLNERVLDSLIIRLKIIHCENLHRKQYRMYYAITNLFECYFHDVEINYLLI